MQNRIDTIKQAVLKVQYVEYEYDDNSGKLVVKKKPKDYKKELAKLVRLVIESETVKTTEKPDNSFSELNFN